MGILIKNDRRSTSSALFCLLAAVLGLMETCRRSAIDVHVVYAFSNTNNKIIDGLSSVRSHYEFFSSRRTDKNRRKNIHRRTMLFMSEGGAEEEENDSNDVLEEQSNQEGQNEETKSKDGEEDEDDEKKKSEDPPEVKALKERIVELESTLAEKKSSLQYNLEQCEEYSKSGYARKVAEMENMRRVRSNIASTSQSSATAAVLRDFLPMYDTLNTLKETYADDEFGAKYGELNLEQTFQTLGVSPYDVVPGEEINNFRMKVIDSEVSEEQPKNTVLRQVGSGLELDGNVIRPASCISSSGSGDDDNNVDEEEQEKEESE